MSKLRDFIRKYLRFSLNENIEPVLDHNYFQKSISEAFDSNVEIQWQKGVNWIGLFTTPKGKKFKIEILAAHGVPYHTCYGFKFTRWNEKENAYRMILTNDNDESFIVFGTLAKGMFEFINDISPDILFFVGDEKRKSLYKQLGYRAAMVKKDTYGHDEYELGNDYIFALLNIERVNAEAIDYIKKNIRNIINPSWSS